MNFDFTDDQRQIKQTAHDFLAARYKPERVRELAETDRGFADADWAEIAELGWAGLAVGEQHGGQGLGAVELIVIMEEMGYALAPGPLLSNTAAALVLDAGGSDEQKEEFLGPIARGERRATMAGVDAGSRGNPGEATMRAEPNGGGFKLSGTKLFVADAAAADWLIVVDAEGTRFIVDAGAPGVAISPLPSIDSTRKQYAVALDGVEVPAERVMPGGWEEIGPARERVTVALCAESVGVAQRTLEMAVAYAKEREQFGRPIGAYQAVSHRCAQMLLEVEGARSLTYYAAWTADHEPESLPLAASMAKAYASDAGCRVPSSALQVHGGIGFTWEHDLHLWLKRGRNNAVTLGDARWHRERVASLTGLQ